MPNSSLGARVRRREFITLLGGAAAGWSLAASAQQPTMPVIGFLNSGSLGAYQHLVAGFRQGLKETGYVEGENVAIEYRWAEGQYDRLPGMAADLVRRRVNVIAAVTTPAALAAEAAATTIPVVFDTAGDPVRLGLVNSLNRPGRNITGITQLGSELVAKRLGLLRDLIPTATVIGMLVNPTDPKIEDSNKGRARGGSHARAANLCFECQHGGRNKRSVCKIGRTPSRRSHRRNWRALQ